MLNYSKEEKMFRRDTKRYKLVNDGKVVYYGISDDPERRREEHKDEGKQFDRMDLIKPPVTRRSAERWEEERLEAFRRTHRGRNPRYNETKK